MLNTFSYIHWPLVWLLKISYSFPILKSIYLLFSLMGCVCVYTNIHWKSDLQKEGSQRHILALAHSQGYRKSQPSHAWEFTHMKQNQLTKELFVPLMLIPAQFTISKIRNQSRSLPIIKKMWYISTMEYYSTMKTG